MRCGCPLGREKHVKGARDGEIIEGEEEGGRFATLGRGFCIGVTPLGEWLFLVQSGGSFFLFYFSFSRREMK